MRRKVRNLRIALRVPPPPPPPPPKKKILLREGPMGGDGSCCVTLAIGIYAAFLGLVLWHVVVRCAG